MIDIFRQAVNIPKGDFIYACSSPENSLIHSIPRIILLIEGSSGVSYYSNGEIKNIICDTGTRLFAGKNGYLYTRLIGPSKSISMSFYGDYIRSMFIDYDGKNQPPTSRDIFYHTDRPVDANGRNILTLMELLSSNNDQVRAISPLCEAMIEVTIGNMLNSEAGVVQLNFHLWNEMDNYLRNHCDKVGSRKEIAQRFNISCSSISHLFKLHTGNSFFYAVNLYRMKRAELLLKTTNSSIAEIGEQCGFASCSYFIASFKKQYNCTPFEYRKKN